MSYLSTTGTVLERLIMARLVLHISPSLHTLQPANRPYHSTETALLNIVSDMFEAVDFGCATVVVALDLGVAFDTIDNSVLAMRLEHTFGVNAATLIWIKSYINGRSCYAEIKDAS